MYIIGNGKLVTLSKTVPYCECGAVVVDGCNIVDAGHYGTMLKKYSGSEVIDANGAIIAPGFIDMHAHSRNTFFYGKTIPRFSCNKRFKMFKDFFWATEAKLDHSAAAMFAYTYAMLAIKNGITTVFEHHSAPIHISGSLHSVASVFRECGLRSCICYDVSNRFGARKMNLAITENIEFIEYCSNLNIDTLKPMFGMHSVLDITDEILEACIRANKNKIGIHIHIGETPEEELISMRLFGKNAVQRLLDEYALTPNSIVSCGAFITADELELLFENNCNAVISPIQSAILCSNYSFDFEKAALEGKLGLASDSLCSSLLDIARIAAYQFGQNDRSTSNIFMPSFSMLFSANPAAATKIFGKKLGVIEPGAAADIIVLRQSLPRPSETYEELLCSLISSGAVCELTMVNGRLLMRDERLVDINEKEIVAAFTAVLKNLEH